MSTENLFLAAFKSAKELASHDDLDGSGVFSPEAVTNYKKLEGVAHDAELLLNELDYELRVLLSAMNTDKDGSMFLCEEAVPNFNRVVKLREEINALATRLAGTGQSG